MPLHRLAYSGDIAALVAELEKSEELVSVAPDGDGLWVLTKPKPRIGRPPKGVETR